MLALLLVTLSAAGAEAPPRGLACLARHYPLTPKRTDGAWQGVLPDGTAVPWNDGRDKTDLERFEHPDLHDMLLEPYPRGPIIPITTVDADPGRMRVESLFFATYGASRSEVDRRLVTIVFLGQRIRVHPRVAEAFARVAKQLAPRLDGDPLLRERFQNLGGTFNWRRIAGAEKLSTHSYGISIDLNASRSEYWKWRKADEPIRWRNSIPREIVEAFESEGFIWGGRWYHYDTMHFEYRPELLDPDCVPAD